MKSFYSIIASAFVLASGSALAQPDLIGTASLTRSGATLEIGLASDSDVYGLQFDVKAPKGVSFKNARLDGCLAGLPAAFSASTCTLIDAQTIRVVVLSLSSAVVPSTVFGTISLADAKGSKGGLSTGQALSADGISGIKFENVVIGDRTGKRIEPGLVSFSTASNRSK